jgi:hypothetical protein
MVLSYLQGRTVFKELFSKDMPQIVSVMLITQV